MAIRRGYALGVRQSRQQTRRIMKVWRGVSVEIDMEDDQEGFGGAMQWGFSDPGICDLRKLGIWKSGLGNSKSMPGFELGNMKVS